MKIERRERKHSRLRLALKKTVGLLGILLLFSAPVGCLDLSKYKFVITNYDPDQAYNGYTFFQTNYNYGGVFAVDMDGQVLWHRQAATGLGGAMLGLTVGDDGNAAANIKGYPEIFNPVTDTLVWEDPDYVVHHMLFVSDWGTLFFLSTETFQVDYPPWSACFLISEIIMEVDMATHELLWEWHLKDNVDPVAHHWEGMCEPAGALKFEDWSHSNTLENYPNYVYDGQSYNTLLLNARHLDTFYMIDYPSGDILWSVGQHGDFGRREPPEEPLFDTCHAVDLLDNGNFILYDNGNLRLPPLSRALEIAVDPVAQTAEEVWSWTDPDEYQWDWWGGDADRLPNGNTLLTKVVLGKIIEVNPQGEKVWEMTMRHQTDPGTLNYTIYNNIRVTEFGP